MKRIIALLSFAFLLAGLAPAQNYFEGIIVYQIKVEGENADQMAAFMPTSYQYTISGSNLRFKMNGGMTAAMMGEILVRGDESKVYMLKDAEQIAYLMPDNDEGDQDNSDPPTIEKLNETSKIAGYNCTKYKVTSSNGDEGEMDQYIWVTNELNLRKPKTKVNSGGDIFVEGMEGFPLKIESRVQGMTIVMTATEVTKKSIPASDFVIPSSYEIQKFDPSSFMGGMGR